MQRVTIPIFPLPCVVFPGEPFSLHIFEEKYKLLIRQSLENEEQGKDAAFGITCSNEEKTFLSGCTVTIEQVLKTYKDGRLDILTRGQKRYTAIEIVSKTPFPVAMVEFFNDINDSEVVDPNLANQAITLHAKLLEIAQGSPQLVNPPENQKLSFFLAHSAGLELEQRQTLLDYRSEHERLEYLVNYYRAILPLAQTQQEVKARVNLNGHLRTLKAQDIKL